MYNNGVIDGIGRFWVNFSQFSHTIWSFKSDIRRFALPKMLASVFLWSNNTENLISSNFEKLCWIWMIKNHSGSTDSDENVSKCGPFGSKLTLTNKSFSLKQLPL